METLIRTDSQAYQSGGFMGNYATIEKSGSRGSGPNPRFLEVYFVATRYHQA